MKIRFEMTKKENDVYYKQAQRRLSQLSPFTTRQDAGAHHGPLADPVSLPPSLDDQPITSFPLLSLPLFRRLIFTI
jgi:hypothetical protein